MKRLIGMMLVLVVGYGSQEYAVNVLEEADVTRDEQGDIIGISLSFLGFEITDDGLAQLNDLTNLQYLNLSLCENITDDGLAHLKNLTNLETLYLGGPKITDAGLVYLKELTNLQDINLSFCENITADGLVHLKDLTNLQNLDLSNCQNIMRSGKRHRGLLPIPSANE